MRKVQLTVPAPAEFGTDVIAVPETEPLELELRLESVMEGVLVSGSVRGSAVGECVRCLGDVRLDLDAPVTELFVYPERAAASGEDDDELRGIEDDQIDLEPTMRDAVVPALPFQPVCSDDCPGLCSECGARLADDPDHTHEALDPRWSALEGLAVGGPDDEKEK